LLPRDCTPGLKQQQPSPAFGNHQLLGKRALVSSGLARIYGTRTPLPDGRDSRQYLAHLHALENAEGCGVWRVGYGAVVNWEIIADNLKKADWSYGYVSAIDSSGRTIWIADAHRDDGKRFVARANETLTAFLELESAIHQFAVDLIAS
jgi:hypothetical protein